GVGGAAGAGGVGGTAALEAEAICRQWCRNEQLAPSCCVADCRDGCLEPCLESAAGVCGAELIAARRCQLDLACDDFFRECDDAANRAEQCVVQVDAPERCDGLSMVCLVDSAECVSAHDGDPVCALAWASYTRCAVEPFGSCAECSAIHLDSLTGCGFPDGAALEDFGDNPPECLALPTPPSGCGDRCPSGSDSQCGSRTFCSDGNFCDAECFSSGDCESGERCADPGRCELIPPQCGDGNAIDPTHASAARPLDCVVMGIPIPLEILLTANPTAPIAPGDNTFDLQMQLTLPVAVVNLVINLTEDGTATELVGTVAATAGTSDTNTVGLSTTPLPCDVTFIEDRPIDIPTQAGQGTWALDQGSPQELTLRDVRFVLDVAGLELELATDGDDPACEWTDAGPPTLQFSIPPD
ncbi:MAG: hypothetical protein WBG86_03835, partial [Polyangiales bacterium]